MQIPPLAQALLWLALIAGMLWAFFVFVRAWRERRDEEETLSASELMAHFRDLHDQGDLSDVEFRRIKERLTPQLQLEMAEGGAADIADAARSLKETARTLLAGWAGAAGEPDKRETSGAAGGAAREDCDAEPPSGGDSTQERR